MEWVKLSLILSLLMSLSSPATSIVTKCSLRDMNGTIKVLIKIGNDIFTVFQYKAFRLDPVPGSSGKQYTGTEDASGIFPNYALREIGKWEASGHTVQGTLSNFTTFDPEKKVVGNSFNWMTYNVDLLNPLISVADKIPRSRLLFDRGNHEPISYLEVRDQAVVYFQRLSDNTTWVAGDWIPGFHSRVSFAINLAVEVDNSSSLVVFGPFYSVVPTSQIVLMGQPFEDSRSMFEKVEVYPAADLLNCFHDSCLSDRDPGLLSSRLPAEVGTAGPENVVLLKRNPNTNRNLSSSPSQVVLGWFSSPKSLRRSAFTVCLLLQDHQVAVTDLAHMPHPYPSQVKEIVRSEGILAAAESQDGAGGVFLFTNRSVYLMKLRREGCLYHDTMIRRLGPLPNQLKDMTGAAYNEMDTNSFIISMNDTLMTLQILYRKDFVDPSILSNAKPYAMDTRACFDDGQDQFFKKYLNIKSTRSLYDRKLLRSKIILDQLVAPAPSTTSSPTTTSLATTLPPTTLPPKTSTSATTTPSVPTTASPSPPAPVVMSMTAMVLIAVGVMLLLLISILAMVAVNLRRRIHPRHQTDLGTFIDADDTKTGRTTWSTMDTICTIDSE